MNKIRVIDLLNKIANGAEVPKKIKWDYEEWEYIEEMKDYYSFNRHIHLFNTVFPNDGLAEYLNDEIEIIEEDKKIEKLFNCCMETDNQEIQFCIQNINDAANKINELIDEVNKLKDGNNDR